MKKSLLYLFPLMAITLSACNGAGGGEMDYIPFKSSSSGDCGLINNKGDVIFDSEFSNDITAANNGAFFGKNNKGEWLLYSTKDKTPKPIGEPYMQAGAFISGVAPTVRSGEKIKLIKPDGSVAVELDQADGKPIKSCGNFYEGLAVITTEKGGGVINMDGEVVVKPAYVAISNCSDGMMVAAEVKEGSDIASYKFIDKSGKVTATLNSEEYEIMGNPGVVVGVGFQHGAIGMYHKEKDGSTKAGLMDKDGKWIVNPTSKIKAIGAIEKDQFIYMDADEKCGIMDFSGKVKIAPKYSNLHYACEGNLLLAKDEDSGKWSLLNDKLENVAGTVFEEFEFTPAFPDAVFAKVDDDRYIMYDRRGEQVKCNVNIADVLVENKFYGDEVVLSQYVDVDHLVDMLGITENGMLGLTLDMKPLSIIRQINKATGIICKETPALNDTITVLSEEPSSYLDSFYINQNLTLPLGPGLMIGISAEFDRYIAEYSSNWDYYSGYSSSQYYFNEVRPEALECHLYVYNGKNAVNLICKELAEKISKLGKVVYDKKGYCVVKGTKGNWYVYKDKISEVSDPLVTIQYTSKPVNDLVRDAESRSARESACDSDTDSDTIAVEVVDSWSDSTTVYVEAADTTVAVEAAAY